MKFLLHIVLLFLFVVSCNSSKEAMEKSQKQQSMLSGEYTISQVEDNNYSAYNLSIAFNNKLNQVTGFAGCNRFFGSYTAEGNTLKFSAIGATKKYCQGEINIVENNFLKALNSVNAFYVKDNVLLLQENKNTLLTANKSDNSKISNVDNNTYHKAVIYETTSRGRYEYLSISKSNISISADKGLQNVNHYTCQENDWSTLNGLLEATDLETLHKLKAPSDKGDSDATAEAVLRIQIGDVEYSTQPFDHGNPPKEIETLVNKVLSIKENTVKQ